MNNIGSMIDEETIKKLNLLKEKTLDKSETPAKSKKELLKSKADGAKVEITRQAKRDLAVEENLSDGLESSATFNKVAKKINKKRDLVVTKAKVAIDKKVSKEIKVKPAPFIFDEAMKKAMIELEQELVDPFAKFVYEKMSETNKRMLLDHLVDNIISRTESKIIDVDNISDANQNVVSFSDNGYLMQLTNKELIRFGKNIPVDNKEALYNIIAPDGRVISKDSDYDLASEALKTYSEMYQGQLSEEFSNIEQEDALNKEEAEDKDLEEYLLNQKNTAKKPPIAKADAALQMMEGMLSEDEKNQEQADKENQYLADFKEQLLPDELKPESEADLVSPDNLASLDAVDLMQDDNESGPKLDDITPVDSADSIDSIDPVLDTGLDNNPDLTKTPDLDSSVSSYAESIGIKKEDLSANDEFLSLNVNQQQFVLETLRRSSLVKAKSEARENFDQEKASKEWWKLGFAFNQNYHKKRHQIEAVQNLQLKGLEAYGKTEFEWLIQVVKNGPEVITNKEGQLEVNCLHDDNFSDETKALIASYNEEARKYIELPKEKTNGVPFSDFRSSSQEVGRDKLSELRSQILTGVSDEDLPKLIYNLTEAEKNIKLLRFLSANKATEEIIKKIENSSTGGFGKTKRMVGSHKDKIGYSALGFSVRTGAHFALATNAYLATALSYSVAPAVASIIGGFRAYNRTRQELNEKEEFAQIGFKDDSATAKTMNLAAGKKEGVSGQEIKLGLNEKLEELINRIENLKNNSASQEEIKKVQDSLENRVKYTIGRMSDGLVSYGPVSERGVNYYNLVNTLARAQGELYIRGGLLRESSNYGYLDKDAKNSTRYNNKIVEVKRIENESDEDYKKRYQEANVKFINWATDEQKLEELKKISVEDRLSSFLGYQEDKRSQQEVKLLAKNVAWGMVLGASFATAGAFVAEHLGVNNWLGNHNPLKSVGRGTSSFFHSVGHGFRSIFSEEDVVPNSSSSGSAAKIIEEATSGKTVSDVSKNAELNSAGKTIPTSNETVAATKGTASSEALASKNATPKVEKFTNEISNKELNGKHDSVWRSVREIFKNRSAELGYKGDPSDQTALNRWAETQTANAIHNSGDVSDAVYEGDKVELIQEGGQLKVEVDHINSPEPGEVSQDLNNSGDKKIEVKLSTKSPVVGPGDEVDAFKTGGNSFTKSEIEYQPGDTKVEVLDTNTKGISNGLTNEIAKLFKVSPDSIKAVGNDLVYQGSSGGKIIFDSGKGVIKEVFDNNNKIIPQEFVDELKGRLSTEKFARRGGLEKIFSSWNKLSASDKTIYESLRLFNKNNLTSAELINKIGEVFSVKTEGVYFDSINKHFVVNGDRNFDMTFKGVGKLVRILVRKN